MAPSYIIFLTKPRNITLLIVVYLLAHFLLRLTFGPVLGLDDAEQTLFAQQWVWSYRFEQPPLFTWLLYPTFELMGVNFVALAIWRYIWLAVILAGSYRLLLVWFHWGKDAAEDRLYAALGMLSLLLIYVVAYFSHHDLTHTTVMTAFIVLGLMQFTRLVEKPDWKNYLLLGCVFAGGLLGKWNYVIFCAALTFACLLVPAYRSLILTPKILIAIAAVTLLVLPTLVFVAGLERPYVNIAESALSSPKVTSMGSVLGKGTGKLIGSLLVYALPFLLFAGIIFFKPLRAGWSGLRSFQAGPPHVQISSGKTALLISPQLLIAFTLVGIGMLWLLVPTLGAVRFTERWMQPVFYPFPFLVLMLVRLGQPGYDRIRRYLISVVVFSLIVFIARFGMAHFSADRCGSCRALIPFPELTEQIKATGFEKGTIIADRFHIGGNMRVAFPDSRVIDPHYPMDVWPGETGQGQCLWVWETARTGEEPPAHFQTYVEEDLDAEWRLPDQRGTATALLHGSDERTFELTWWLFEQPLGNCR